MKWTLYLLLLLFLMETVRSAPPSPSPTQVETSQPDETSCDCQWRYLKHYSAKGCRPIYAQQEDPPAPCRCPVRFQCPQNMQDPDATVCVSSGREYRVGESVSTPNDCEVCHCRLEPDTNRAGFYCRPVECPEAFQPRLKRGCYYVYQEGRCCPAGIRCENETRTSEPVCRHNNEDYRVGQKIYPSEDPCLVCLCSSNWTGPGGHGCHRHDCQLERELPRLRTGCLPIYHQGTCCPIEYHCPQEKKTPHLTSSGLVADNDLPSSCLEPPVFGSCHEAFPRFHFNHRQNTCEEFLYSGCGGNSNRFVTRTDCEDLCGNSRNRLSPKQKPAQDQCVFDRRSYAVGETLNIAHPTHCVTCTCSVPPDFTCIHQSCPPPPDYDHCTAEYKAGACCAQYTCKGTEVTTASIIEQSSVSPNCSVSNCPPGCHPGSSGVSGCPPSTCHCPTKDCVPPKDCPAPECVIESPGTQCPHCVCGQKEAEKEPVMKCAKMECEAGCRLDIQVPAGTCPGCICEGGEDSRSVREARRCPAVSPDCASRPGCQPALSRDGCPQCLCQEEGICLPPDCRCPTDSRCSADDGCHVDASNATRHGHCPVCRCGQGRSLHSSADRLQCPSASKCPDGCQLSSSGSGVCPVCRCGVQPGGSEKPCLPPLCLCGPPRCDAGCQVDRRVPLGRCPGCVCDTDDRVSPHQESRSTDRQKQNQGQQQGHSRCKSPRCEEPCRLEERPAQGQCPSCICRFDKEPDYTQYTRSSGATPEQRNRNGVPHNCPTLDDCQAPDCRIVSVNERCPECFCQDKPSTGSCPSSPCDGVGCRAVVGTDGCPRCQCRTSDVVDPCPNIAREERNCRQPCEWQAKPSRGCPRCLCPKETGSAMLPRPRQKCLTTQSSSCEGSDCRLIPDPEGCPVCTCSNGQRVTRGREGCGTPPCRSPCASESPGEGGRCPICVCPSGAYNA